MSTTSHMLSFHSSVLKESAQKAMSAFQQYRRAMDTMVEDIRSLDKFLNEQGVKMQCWMRCQGLSEGTKDSTLSYELMWLNEGNSGFRLRVRVRSILATDEDKTPWTILSDSSLEMRTAFFPYLPQFIDKLVDAVRRVDPTPKPQPAPGSIEAVFSALTQQPMKHEPVAFGMLPGPTSALGLMKASAKIKL